MVVVLDANVLLISLPRKSTYRPIINALIDGEFDLILTNEILSEYTEIIGRKANEVVSNNVAEMLLSLDNLRKTEVYFQWKLISADPDDNKYVDAAVAGTADFIVSNDQHFKVLSSTKFPRLKVIGIDEFLQLIQDEHGH